MNNLLRRKKRINYKILIPVGLVLVILILFGIFAVYLPAKNAYSLAMQTTQSGRLAYEYLKKQDIEKASTELVTTKNKLLKTQEAYNRLLYLKIIPFFGSYVSDGERSLKAGVYSIEAAQITIDSVKPYADVLGLKGQGSFVMGSAEERIQKAVQTLEKVVPNIDKVLEKLQLAEKEIAPIDTAKYNFKLKNINIRETLTMAKSALTDGVSFIEEAKPAIKILPRILGEPNEAQYVILFQNDKELRSTGGFLTAYAVFKVKSGRIEVEKSEDIYELDKRINSREKPPEMVTKYLKNIYYWNARDTNLSPDFKVSMDKFYSLYKKDDNRKINGIIALDTQFLVSIIKIIGPVEVYGIKFSTDTEPKCDCPKVIYELERFATTQVDYVKEGRKDIIGKLMFEIMKKVLSSPPKQYWGPIIQASVDMLNQKHLLVYLFDPQGEQGIEALNWAGRIRKTNGDYLHINDTNLGGAKSDMFITRSVEQKIEVKKDKVLHYVSIKYNNPYPASNCNLEQKQVLCLNSLYRSVTRIYVPQGSKLIENETRGSETKVKQYDELGKTVFEAFFSMYPQHQATLEFTYEVPIAFDKEYSLLIQKQPGIEKVRNTLSVNGKTQIIDLMKDEDIKVKL
jgi:hypothetical protein